MKYTIQFLANEAQAANDGLSETINLAYGLYCEIFPGTNGSGFEDLTSFCSDADRTTKLGLSDSLPPPAGFMINPNGSKSDNPTLSEGAKLAAVIKARMAPETPYADIFQEIALPEIVPSLLYLGRKYYWFAEPLALESVRLSLKERVNELRFDTDPAGVLLKIPRLQHAITWLQAYENQLSVYLAQQTTPEAPANSPAPVSSPALTSQTTDTPPHPAGQFAPLLLNYSLTELTGLLRELGLLDTTTGKASPAASPGAWVGVLLALFAAERPRLAGSKAAARRGFVECFEAVVSESAVHTGLGKRGSVAETFKTRALAILNE